MELKKYNFLLAYMQYWYANIFGYKINNVVKYCNAIAWTH